VSALSGGACEDGVFQQFRFKTTAGAGGVGIGGAPGWVSGKVAFAGSHLVDPSCYELAQGHKWLWVQAGEVVVIPWCWEEAGPLCKEGLPHPIFQGGVDVIQQGLRKDGSGLRDQV